MPITSAVNVGNKYNFGVEDCCVSITNVLFLPRYRR